MAFLKRSLRMSKAALAHKTLGEMLVQIQEPTPMKLEQEAGQRRVRGMLRKSKNRGALQSPNWDLVTSINRQFLTYTLDDANRRKTVSNLGQAHPPVSKTLNHFQTMYEG